MTTAGRQTRPTPTKPRKKAQDRQDELQKKNLLQELKDHKKTHHLREDSKPIFNDTDVEINDDFSDEDDNEYEDRDTKALRIEIEKIKKERAEDKLLLEISQREDDMIKVKLEDGLLGENPLLKYLTNSFGVKRKWDDDVTFKNQGCSEEKTAKRFVNDTIRSDFHRKFMQRYMGKKLSS